jgi:hypothetical protein
MAGFDPKIYSLQFVQSEGPRPWRWAILKVGLKKPIQRSTRSFASEAEVREDGEAALLSLLDILRARRHGGRAASHRNTITGA